MAPVHVHAWNGEVYPCCLSNVGPEHQFGNLNNTSLQDILNTDKAKQLRKNMLEGQINLAKLVLDVMSKKVMALIVYVLI